MAPGTNGASAMTCRYIRRIAPKRPTPNAAPKALNAQRQAQSASSKKEFVRMPHPNAARLRGLLTAILTPFDLQGRLALERFPALLDFQRGAGVDGVIVCGTNGEGTSMSVEERQQT